MKIMGCHVRKCIECTTVEGKAELEVCIGTCPSMIENWSAISQFRHSSLLIAAYSGHFVVAVVYII